MCVIGAGTRLPVRSELNWRSRTTSDATGLNKFEDLCVKFRVIQFDTTAFRSPCSTDRVVNVGDEVRSIRALMRFLGLPPALNLRLLRLPARYVPARLPSPWQRLTRSRRCGCSPRSAVLYVNPTHIPLGQWAGQFRRALLHGRRHGRRRHRRPDGPERSRAEDELGEAAPVTVSPSVCQTGHPAVDDQLSSSLAEPPGSIAAEAFGWVPTFLTLHARPGGK